MRCDPTYFLLGFSECCTDIKSEGQEWAQGDLEALYSPGEAV